MPRRRLIGSLWLCALLAAGCRGGAGHKATLPSPSPTPAPATGGALAASQLAGRWSASSAGASPDGDLEDVREDWSLHASGDRISGHYLRVVTRKSTDGRVFDCNRGDAYTRRARIAVDGTVAADGTLKLTERSAEVAPGLCDDGTRRLTTLAGRLGGVRLELVRDGVALALDRVAAGVAGADPDAAPRWSGAGGAADLAGLWQSVVVRRDEIGQLRTEFEVWHLGADGRDLAGYYDHVVTVTAREGHTFACSSSAEYTLRTRYRVAGLLDGATVFLNETSYETVPAPCENNQRRLERYQGRAAGDELLLAWGGGVQLLKRVVDGAAGP